MYSDGDKYQGNFLDGCKDGYGTYTSSDGSVYVGMFKDDQRHGKGELTHLKGTKFVGWWENGQPEGNGKITIPDEFKVLKDYVVNQPTKDELEIKGNWEKG